jgi:hypothetical protein
MRGARLHLDGQPGADGWVGSLIKQAVKAQGNV